MKQVHGRPLVRRTLQCLAIGIFSAALVLPTTAWVLNWHERSVYTVNLRQREADALGNENPPTPDNFHPLQVVPRPPIVSEFTVVSAIDSTDKVHDGELVPSTEINSQARAWPLNVMTRFEREVFNDILGGLSIAATW